jgi:hypothetical protein
LKNTTIKLILAISLLVCTKVFGQANYQQGYVVNLKGDTLKGFIDYRKWDKNPTEIRFKSAEQDKYVTYDLANTSAFGVMDSHYIRATTAIDTSSANINQLTYLTEPEIKMQTMFLLRLVDGSKSLLYYKDDNAKVNFFIKNGENEYSFLLYKQFFKDRDGAKVIAANKKYLSQLTAYLTDCPSIASKLNNVSYNRSSLVSLFEDYYLGINTAAVYTKKTDEKKPAEWGIILAASLTQFSIKNSNLIPFDNLDGQTSVNPVVGVTYELFFPGNNNSWSLINEVAYTSYVVKDHRITAQSPSISSDDDAKFGYSFIKISNMLRLKFSGSFFANAGVANGIAISNTNYTKSKSVYYSTTTTTEKSVIPDDLMRKLETSLLFGIGTAIKNYTIQLRAELSNGAVDGASGSPHTQKAYLLIGYRF